jgi:hypothetical protein
LFVHTHTHTHRKEALEVMTSWAGARADMAKSGRERALLRVEGQRYAHLHKRVGKAGACGFGCVHVQEMEGGESVEWWTRPPHSRGGEAREEAQ